jgi:heterodisulfide reductase subunit A-like polyferredoxin
MLMLLRCCRLPLLCPRVHEDEWSKAPQHAQVNVRTLVLWFHCVSVAAAMATASVVVTGCGLPDEVLETEILVVGGGICGILAAKECADRRWPYIVVDRNKELGGVWSTLANRHSYLQARIALGSE